MEAPSAFPAFSMESRMLFILEVSLCMRLKLQRLIQFRSSEADFSFLEPEINLFSRLNDRASIALESPETVVDDAKHDRCSEY